VSARDEIEFHITGSQSVAQLGDVAASLAVLLDALAGHGVSWSISARVVCAGCGVTSEVLDLTEPAVVEAALGRAGWVRDAVSRDMCPACTSHPGGAS
jgi:hypothetical protein